MEEGRSMMISSFPNQARTLFARRVRDSGDRVELEPLKAIHRECLFQEIDRLIAIPWMHPRKAVQPSRMSATGICDELDGVRIDLRHVCDRHDYALLNPRLIHPFDA